MSELRNGKLRIRTRKGYWLVTGQVKRAQVRVPFMSQKAAEAFRTALEAGEPLSACLPVLSLSRASRVKGGRLGGPARAAALEPARRSDIARQAAVARWADHNARKAAQKEGVE